MNKGEEWRLATGALSSMRDVRVEPSRISFNVETNSNKQTYVIHNKSRTTK